MTRTAISPRLATRTFLSGRWAMGRAFYHGRARLARAGLSRLKSGVPTTDEPVTLMRRRDPFGASVASLFAWLYVLPILTIIVALPPSLLAHFVLARCGASPEWVDR